MTFVAALVSKNLPKTPAAFALLVDACRKRRLIQQVFAIAQDEAERSLKTGEIDPVKVEEIVGMYSELKGLISGGFDPGEVLLTGSALQAMDVQVEWTLERLVPARSLTLSTGQEAWERPGCPGDRRGRGQGRDVPLRLQDDSEAGRLYRLRESMAAAHRPGPASWYPGSPVHSTSRPSPGRPSSTGPTGSSSRNSQGSLLIFDTARASHDGDENSSQDVGLVMGRLKELRELGNDILLLHHTTKLNEEKASKGSTAWEDLADHVLAFYKCKQGTLEEIEGREFDPEALLSLGTGRKTQFELLRSFLTFNLAAEGFVLASDPTADAINALAEYISGPGLDKNQGEIFEWARDAIGIGRKGALIPLLRRGEREGRWHTRRALKGAESMNLADRGAVLFPSYKRRERERQTPQLSRNRGNSGNSKTALPFSPWSSCSQAREHLSRKSPIPLCENRSCCSHHPGTAKQGGGRRFNFHPIWPGGIPGGGSQARGVEVLQSTGEGGFTPPLFGRLRPGKTAPGGRASSRHPGPGLKG
ncbi:MAG: hypothetical protein M0C28_02935 [Candidatus Moduliflexus flocculans]|nr:hypothetical protein [Candidatus Moduliflexus flocculans]